VLIRYRMRGFFPQQHSVQHAKRLENRYSM
jgi:hypothetical protein